MLLHNRRRALRPWYHFFSSALCGTDLFRSLTLSAVTGGSCRSLIRTSPRTRCAARKPSSALPSPAPLSAQASWARRSLLCKSSDKTYSLRHSFSFLYHINYYLGCFIPSLRRRSLHQPPYIQHNIKRNLCQSLFLCFIQYALSLPDCTEQTASHKNQPRPIYLYSVFPYFFVESLLYSPFRS